jgi:RNA polymerase sigma-70 factor (ECF subfamily)
VSLAWISDAVNEESRGAVDELLFRARAGEAAAFAAIVRAHQRAIFSLALRMLSDWQRAEDLAQDVFLQLHRNLSAMQSPAHLAFWLRRVTMNRAIDQLRREPRLEGVPLEQALVPGPEGESDPLLQRRLRQLVARLAPAARAVVVLRYQEDLDPVDIARTLAMSLNTVKSHLKRSLATLRESIGEDAGTLT